MNSQNRSSSLVELRRALAACNNSSAKGPGKATRHFHGPSNRPLPLGGPASDAGATSASRQRGSDTVQLEREDKRKAAEERESERPDGGVVDPGSGVQRLV